MALGTNPILDMDFPDPDVIRVGNTYYMVTTTMHFFPGCEILRSYDLINWEHLTYVYERLDSTPAQRLEGEEYIYGKGMWAATIRYHKGLFYILFVANDTQKTYLYRSADIMGPWKKSTVEGFYHDASLLFDNGKTYIVYGNTQIYLTELNEELTGPKEGGLHRLIVNDEGNPNLGLEGSHIYKINGLYYLFMIHSRRDRWMRTEACYIADSLEGEFTGGDVLEDDMGLTGAGVAQGGIVDDGNGNWYAVLFQDSGAIGRIPVVVPVKIDGRRVTFGTDGKVPKTIEINDLRGEGASIKRLRPLFGSDDFSEPELKYFWQFSHEPDLSLVDIDTDEGVLSITTDKLSKNIFHARNVLTQRMIRPYCEAKVTVDASCLNDGDFAGLSVYQGDFAFVAVTKRDGQFYAVMRNSKSTDNTWNLTSDPGDEQEAVLLDDDKLKIRIKADFSDGKDEAVCSIMSSSGWRQIGCVHKMTFRLDHFTGARFGLFVYSTLESGGTANFSNFIYKV